MSIRSYLFPHRKCYRCTVLSSIKENAADLTAVVFTIFDVIFDQHVIPDLAWEPIQVVSHAKFWSTGKQRTRWLASAGDRDSVVISDSGNRSTLFRN